MFALPVCDIKPRKSKGSSAGATLGSSSLDISQAIPTVVLKLAALANNSEPDYPLFSSSDLAPLNFWAIAPQSC